MSTISLTPVQHAILAHALEHTGGRIEWFPDHIKGGARQKVLAGLANRALIARQGDDWVVADEGYGAMGRERPAPATPAAAPLETDQELEAAVTAAEATWAQQRPTAKPRTRTHSKQAEVIRMLQRPEGATLRQIVKATGWLSHTVRGTLSGALKKRLGLNIVSEKVGDTDRVYRILP